MASETGHAVNIGNLDKLNKVLKGMGTKYDPSNNDIKLAALQTLYTDADKAANGLKDAKAGNKKAGADRRALFDPLDTLSRRIVRTARGAGATDDQVAALEEYARKIQGERAGTKNPDPVNPDDPKSISVSQQSFINLASHFSGILSTLARIDAYAPNEADLKVTALTTLYNSLKGANSDAGDAEVAETNAKTARNTLLYAPKTGLTALVKKVKDYVFGSSELGAKNPDYKLVNAIRFRDLSDD